MDISVDFSFFPGNLMQIVIDSLGTKSSFVKSLQSSSINNSSQKIINPTISIFVFPGNLKELRSFEMRIAKELHKGICCCTGH